MKRSINILGTTYRITKQALLQEHGACIPEARQIILDQDLEEPGSVLLHEVLHAILWESGHSFRLDDRDEEALVRVLESGLWKAGYRLE